MVSSCCVNEFCSVPLCNLRWIPALEFCLLAVRSKFYGNPTDVQLYTRAQWCWENNTGGVPLMLHLCGCKSKGKHC